MCVLSHLSRVQLPVTPWTIAHQTCLPMGLIRQENWSGLTCLPPGVLPNAGIKPTPLLPPHWQASPLPLAPPGKPV